jgi:hypothetical protein
VRRPPKKAMALTAGALAAVAAAIAIPAWAASSGGDGSGSSARGHRASQLPPLPPGFGAAIASGKRGALPPPPSLNGKARKRLDKTAQCLRSHAGDIPGAHTSAHGFSIGPNVDRSALQKGAKACGAPPLPPRGATFQMRFGPPPKGRPKVPPRIGHCLGPVGKRPGHTQR